MGTSRSGAIAIVREGAAAHLSHTLSFLSNAKGYIAMALTKLEKLMFPGFLLAFEVVFIVLFGLLVRYDDRGDPVPETGTSIDIHDAGNGTTIDVATRGAESSRSTIKTYPRK